MSHTRFADAPLPDQAAHAQAVASIPTPADPANTPDPTKHRRVESLSLDLGAGLTLTLSPRLHERRGVFARLHRGTVQTIAMAASDNVSLDGTVLWVGVAMFELTRAHAPPLSVWLDQVREAQA